MNSLLAKIIPYLQKTISTLEAALHLVVKVAGVLRVIIAGLRAIEVRLPGLFDGPERVDRPDSGNPPNLFTKVIM